MEDLRKKVENVMDQYFREEAGNRLSQFSFRTLKEIILNEIMLYKPGENKKADNTCRPIIDKSDKSTEQKIIRK